MPLYGKLPLYMKLPKHQFTQWLKSRGDDIVGKSCEGGACPIANYFRENHKINHRVIHISIVGCMVNREWFQLPLWAKKLVMRLDRYGKRDYTGEDVLKVLTALN